MTLNLKLARRAHHLALLLLLAGGSVVHAPRSEGCATAYRDGPQVSIATESAVILWDAAKKTQHFIRRASFTTDAEDFGFLVPTPTQPIIAATDDTMFKRLEELTAAMIEVVHKTKWDWVFPLAMSADSFPSTGVRILEEGRIGNLDYAVLEADQAVSLSDWLRKHGYSSRPALSKWLEPYVAKQWKITAFKIAKEKVDRHYLATSGVRMSFRTEKPFFPYREPEDQKKVPLESRLLRIFFIGSKRMQGHLGARGEWPGQVAYAGPLPAEDRSTILGQAGLPESSVPRSAWITVMDDESTLRPGDEDVFFSVSPDQSRVTRPPLQDIRYTTIQMGWIWIVAPLILALLLMLLETWWSRRKARQTRSPTD